ncbi:MAG: AarF/ABC1/UbiB kinase family protein [Deltaproteobacteria bacterium]|nr:MAG: AarF/ABC1/UbiB kinase family protein [Deltaproteobacteria bacterium]
MPIPRRVRDRARHLRKVATSAAGFGVRRLLRDRPEDAELLGEALLGELDELKGMAMKVGQILSYMDGALPPETQARLARLQRGQSPLPWLELAPRVDAALGPRAADLDVDPVAVAAASIGQVHRARLGDVDVAVKVQYPEVRETFEADVTQLRRLAGLAGLASSVDGQAIVDDLRDRLVEECDYAHEARWQRQFRTWFADDPEVRVPEVLADYSTETVLTTRWCDGVPLEDFLDADPDSRNAAGLTLARFAWRSMFHHGVIHADPHPGNQLYTERAVVFLDFGCVRQFESAWLDATRRELCAVLDGDRVGFREAVLDSGMVPDPRRFDFDEHWAMQRQLWAPYLTDDYAFTPGLLAEASRFSRPTNPNLRRLAIPPPWIWLARLQWGLHSVLVRLRTRGAYATLLRTALEEG